MSNIDKIGYKVIVSGKVQDVGFRYFTAKEAHKLTIFGHAKNLSDGTVEVRMFGQQTQLWVLLKWLEHGPNTATVDDTEVTEALYRHEKTFLCL